MASLNKGLKKVEIRLRWDPSPLGRPPHDLDIIAATYTAEEPYGKPSYVVHFGSRSPDGTITLSRDSRTGQGFGFDEVMVLELERLAAGYARVVVGVIIQQRSGDRTFQDIANPRVVITEGHTELAADDLARVADSTAATVAEFARDASGEWELREALRGFDGDPESFAAVMGSRS
ncbi:TerD family protein [Streptomyces himalayensis]|uniref:TerD family protein n=1 Tax=Streptomyces himalayensis subsp. himalayensis TaxID=2756131 RepID=A0A7W0DU11_9ACTN|nr:TerD family protein [Streptomyces himalayensis]MBA2950743.1 TerD family protein [Streptomyces himalayensis subsp. himalayensis]